MVMGMSSNGATFWGSWIYSLPSPPRPPGAGNLEYTEFWWEPESRGTGWVALGPRPPCSCPRSACMRSEAGGLVVCSLSAQSRPTSFLLPWPLLGFPMCDPCSPAVPSPSEPSRQAGRPLPPPGQRPGAALNASEMTSSFLSPKPHAWVWANALKGSAWLCRAVGACLGSRTAVGPRDETSG